MISLNNDLYYYSTTAESIPHCEIYNFSVATTYFGTTYSGANCGIPISDVILFYKDNFLDSNNLWTEVKFLGELILNITVNVEVV